MAQLLLLGPPMDEARAEQVQPARSRQDGGAGARVFLVEDDLLHKARTTAAILPGPGEPDPARGVHRPLPGDAFFECLAVGRDALVGGIVDADVGWQIGLEPAADLGAKLGMLRAVGKVHSWNPCGRSKKSRLSAGARRDKRC